MRIPVTALLLASACAGLPATAAAQTMEDSKLVAALRGSGHVIVMRHARSPGQPPTAPNSDNPTRERQLDEAGRATAAAMGEAIRRLKIPVGDVLTSPTYRARETARRAGWDTARSYPELGDGGQSMKRAEDAQATWLRRTASEPPATANTVVITHQPNIAAAFREAADVAEGEALVFRPDGKGRTRMIARVPIERWPTLK